MPKRLIAAVVSIIAGFVSILFAVSVAAQQECPSPRLVDEIQGQGDRESPPFDTSTNLLRITYNVQAERETQPFFLDLREAADPAAPAIANASVEGSESGETFANAPPGRYFLEISTSTQYTIKIEECGEAQASPKEGTSVPGTNQPKGPQPKASPPVQPPPPPPAQPKASPPPQPTPAPQPIPQPQPIPPAPPFNAGGPERGPVPPMPDGGCPQEYPDARSSGCFR